MAIYKSNAYIKGAHARPDSQVEAAESTFTVTIPAGVTLAADDLLYFGKLGEGVDVISVAASYDSFDSNASAAFDTSLGVVPSSTAKTHTAVTDIVAYQAFWPETTLTSVNNGGRFNIQKDAGGGTGAVFNIAPYGVLTVPGDVVMVVGTAAATAVTTERSITVRLKYQYAYPGTLITGVSDSTYPWAGSIEYGTPIQYDYNGNAP